MVLLSVNFHRTINLAILMTVMSYPDPGHESVLVLAPRLRYEYFEKLYFHMYLFSVGRSFPQIFFQNWLKQSSHNEFVG